MAGEMDYLNLSYSSYGDLNYTYEDPFVVSPVKDILITIFTTIFALSFFGNFLVVYVIGRNKSMHTVTNFFLANLALADLLVATFCVIPQLLWYVMESWPLGEAICKLHKYMTSATTTASILILTVISVERYIAILHPLETRRVLTTRRLTITVMLVWAVSAVVNIPVAFFYEIYEYDGKDYCATAQGLSQDAAQTHSVVFSVFFYVIPVGIMSVLYGFISRKLWTTSTGKRVFTSGDDGGMQRGSGSRFTGRFTGRFSKSKSTSPTTPNANHSPANTRPSSDKDGTVVLEMSSTTKSEDGHVQFKIASKEEEANENGDKSGNQKIGPFFVDEPVEEGDDVTEADSKAPLMNTSNNNVNGTKHASTKVAIVSGSNRVDRSPVEARMTRNQSVDKDRASKRGTDGRSTDVMKRRNNVMAARKKVIRLLVVIVVSFALCLFPAQLQVMCQAFGHISLTDSEVGTFFQPFSHALYFFNSALNPFLYAFFSDNFRAKFKQTLHITNTQQKNATRAGLQRHHSMTSYAQSQTETMYVSS